MTVKQLFEHLAPCNLTSSVYCAAGTESVQLDVCSRDKTSRFSKASWQALEPT